jgi:hypothetical protein
MKDLVFGNIEIVEEWDDRSVGIGLTIVELIVIIMHKERKSFFLIGKHSRSDSMDLYPILCG